MASRRSLGVVGQGAVFSLLAAGLVGGLCELNASTLQVSIDTIDGVPVVRNGREGQWREGAAWTVEELFRLGGPAAPRGQLFSSILMATSVGPQGSIYVLDFRAEEIGVFSSTGEFRFRIGGSGRGPGELWGPGSIGWDGQDRLWVPNALDGRYTVFDSLGNLVKTISPYERRSVNMLVYPMYFDGKGSFIDQASSADGLHLIRRDTTGAVVDTVAYLPYAPTPSMILARFDDGVATALRSFIPRMRWALGDDGSIWEGRTDRLRFMKRNRDGDTVRIIESRHRSPEFTDVEADLRDRALEGLDDGVVLAPSAFQRIYVMKDGHLLVQIPGEMNEPGDIIDVFDPEGRFMGSVRWPFAMHPKAVPAFRGDTVVAVTADDLDVPYVVKAVIHRPGGPRDVP